ncbi:MAG: cupin domain-containing protein [Solirubrobacteraceae bacterium]|nr:cupin domain-containing protein [Solirubrobacteraceae bacterium]
MQRISLTNPAFEYDDDDPPGMRSGLHRFGTQVGAEQTGTSFYELPPGQALCPYHYEYGEEEWVLVVAGRPTLRDPDGSHELTENDVVFFPRGPAGAHQIRNDTGEAVRVLMWSAVIHPAATVYPDSDKIAVWTGNPDDNLIAPRSAGVDYFHGET